MPTRTYEELVQEFECLCDELTSRPVPAKDEHLRKQSLQIAYNTTKRLRTAYEFATSQAWGQMELAGIVTANDLNIFGILTEQDRPMTIAELAEQAGAAELLVLRILRFLTAHGSIDQVDVQSYTANRMTIEYTKDHWVGLMRTLLFCAPAYIALPEHLRQIEYQNPADPKASAWQVGLDTNETFWEWLKARPDQAYQFNSMLKMPRSAFKDNLVDVYPFERLFEGSNAEDVLFVDVGGGFGQQCVNLRSTFGIQRGRIILQDLPQVVEGRKLEYVEVMAHDMMQPQPVSGARVYYFRGVIHDHSDDVCQKFLDQTVKAMNAQSRLLIHEELVPDMNPGERITRRDLGMMAQFGAMERSESQMKSLLESVGLKFLDRHTSGLSDWVITEASL